MIFDQRVGQERKQFATQVDQINTETKTVLDAGFTGNESVEFYEGLLAGYTCSFQLAQLPKVKENLGCIIAYLSAILEERN